MLLADSKAATFCANVLTLYPALWLFTAIEGVEPTNNHAERILRMGVLWRKNAFGCHSAAGCQFVERMLTVVQTLRLQKRPVLEYLYRAIVAHRAGLPAPQLLGQPGGSDVQCLDATGARAEGGAVQTRRRRPGRARAPSLPTEATDPVENAAPEAVIPAVEAEKPTEAVTTEVPGPATTNNADQPAQATPSGAWSTDQRGGRRGDPGPLPAVARNHGEETVRTLRKGVPDPTENS